MTGKSKYILMMLITAVCIDAASQNSQVLYYMNLPQNHFLNPAIKPVERFYVGLPIITGISAGFGNNFLTVSDFLPSGTKIDSAYFQNAPFDLNKLAGKLKDHNTLTTDASIQLFGLGMSFGKDLYIFFDIVDRTSVKMVLPHDLMQLYITKPDQLMGKTIDLSGMNIEGQYFREYGLGFSKNITSKFRIGVKAKLLSGIASMSLIDRSLTLKVNNDFSQTITADASMDISGKATLNRVFSDNNIIGKSSNTTNSRTNIKGFVSDYLKIPVSNIGVSFDIGAVYNLNKFITFSASVTDLGFINWKSDLKSFKANSTFTLPGVTLKDVTNNTEISIDSLGQSIFHGIKNNFIEAVPQSFKTYLPKGFSAGLGINLLPVISFGVLSNTKIYAGTAQESVTFSANTYLGRILSASMSYTVANYSYNNLGFGLAFKAGIAQFYFIADKIPLSWGKIYYINKDNVSYSPITIPQNMNLLNLQLGMNIVFGRQVTKKADKPMVIAQ